jgi:hypothetical protein
VPRENDENCLHKGRRPVIQPSDLTIARMSEISESFREKSFISWKFLSAASDDKDAQKALPSPKTVIEESDTWAAAGYAS